MKTPPANDPAALRRAAEARLKAKPSPHGPRNAADLRRLQHELEVHQIELVMQNEELRQAQAEIAADLERYTDLYEFAPVGYFNLTPDGTIHLVNLTGAALVGRERSKLVGRRLGLFVAVADRRTFSEFLTRVFASKDKQSCELALAVEGRPPLAVRIEATVSPDGQECRAVLVDLTERRQAEAIIACQTKVLGLIAHGTPLAETLTVMLQIMEAFAPGMLCSVVLLDEDGVHIRHGLAPSLPDAFNRAVEGQPIGPCAGSCGTAAFRRAPVLVEDIATDPLWADYRELALAHGLRACWSTPIFDAQRRVLGTFAIYYRQPGLPTPLHRRCIELATHLAAVAISRQRGETALRESEEKFAKLFRNSPSAILVTQFDGRILDVNESFTRLTGRARAETLGRTTQEVGFWEQPAQRSAFVQRLRDTGRVQDFESQLRPESGALRSIRVSAELMDLGGEPVIIGEVLDITARKQAEDERQKFVLLAESSSEFIGMCDLDLQPFYVNPAGMRMVGLPDLHAACRVKVQDYFFPEDRPFITEEFFPRVQREGHGEVEIRLRHFQTGEAIWMSYSLFHVRDAGGRTIGWATVSRDITERKRTDSSLHEAEARLRLSVAASNIGLWDWNLVTNAVYFSREWKAQIGYGEDELPNRFEEWESRVHPDDLAPTLAKVREFVANPAAEYAVEFRLRHKDGTYRWIFTQAQVFRDPAGKPLRMMGCHIDITERKQTEDALQESEARFAAAFRANPAGVVLSTLAEGRFLDVNPAFLKMFSFTRAQIIGRTSVEAGVVASAEARRKIVEEMRRTGFIRDWEMSFQRPDGSTCHTLRSIERLVLGGEECLLTLIVDTTERKQAQLELEESREQLRALLARLQRAREEERTRVAREIHDELGQLLTGLKMDVRWLERRLSEHDLPRPLLPLLDRAVAASALADATLATVQKIAAGLRPGALDRLGLEAALRQKARAFQERTGVACELVAATCPEVPAAIATELFYICQEALTNVTRHAHATRVEIHLRPEGDGIVLEVRDDGVGMAEAKLHAPRSLGLLGLRERAGQCGGTVTFTRNEPQGTRVTVRVPRANEAAVSAEGAVSYQPGATPQVSARPGAEG